MIPACEVHPSTSPGTEDLAAAAAAGDRTALAALYRQHDRQVFGYVHSRVQSRQVAEDVAADVWLRVLTNIGRYETRDGGFVAWLLTIARNLLATRYRDAQRRPRSVADLVLIQQPCRSAGPLERAVQREQQAALGQALLTLTPSQQAVLRLRYLEGLSEKETAERLDVTVGSVKQAAWRGKHRLRATLGANEPRTSVEAPGLAAVPA